MISDLLRAVPLGGRWSRLGGRCCPRHRRVVGLSGLGTRDRLAGCHLRAPVEGAVAGNDVALRVVVGEVHT